MPDLETMTPEHLQRIEELLCDVLERDPAERDAFLDSSCAGDPGLKDEVKSLMEAHEEAAPFIEEGGLALFPELSAAHDGQMWVGRQIGAYRVVRLLGSGGMGHVYEAVQEKPERTVALKVLKSGIASPSALRRFDYESRILANLRHPGIAQVYEAGKHAEGGGVVPYFAMEYIPDAKSIAEYADANGLAARARLELLVQVCQAVHHGHQRGIIHRDLKPANILVDSTGQPKVIDFGVARATDSDIKVTTLQTDVGQLVGTIAYMSPEQVAGNPTDLDTRSDVYSLGIICYELLTGRLPYDLKGKAVPEAARVIRDEEPTSISSANRLYRGDIETILAKALEKDKTRRYQSAHDLAADIQRYLHDEPITARPASAVYHLRKFARRNRALVLGVAIAFVGLVSGVVFAGWKAIEATDERNRALNAERHAKEQTEAARIEARKAERINRFLQEMLSAADPKEARGRELSVGEILDRAAERIETELADEPAVAASLRHTIGLTYQGLGGYKEAESHLRAALGIRRRILGESDPDTLHSMSALAAVCRLLGRHAEAESLARKAIELSQEVLGEQDPTTLSAMNALALVLQDRGRLAEAEPLYRRLLDIQRRAAGEEDSATLLAMNNLAWLMWSQGKLPEAGDLFAQTLPIRRRVSGDDHPETIRTMINLANVRREQGVAQEAEPLAVEAVGRCRRVLGDRHAMTHYAMDRLVWIHQALGKLDEAEALARETLDLRRQALGEEHIHTFYSMHTLAAMLSMRGKFDEAAVLHRATFDARRRILGPEHPDTLASMSGLAVALGQQYQYEEAESLLREALGIRQRVSGEEHPDTLRAMHNLALILEAGGKASEAEQLFREARALEARVLGPEHRETLNSAHGLARVILARGNAEQAASLLRETVDTAARVLPEGHWLTATIRSDLGRCLTALGDYEQAEAELLSAHADLIASQGQEDSSTSDAARFLADLYDAWGMAEKAAQYRALLPTTHPAPSGDSHGSSSGV